MKSISKHTPLLYSATRCRTLKLWAYLLLPITCFLLPLGFSSCSSSDDTALTPLATPTLSVVESKTASNRLAFHWKGTEGTYEYAYKLLNAKGNYIEGDLSNAETATFHLLNPATTYKLSVVAYPRIGNSSNYGQSEAKIIEAKTSPVTFNTAIDGNEATISWTDFQDIDSVKFTVTNSENEEDTYTGYAPKNGNATYKADSLGNYNFAISRLYSGSDSVDISNATTSLEIEKLYRTLWTVTGSAYLNGLDKTIPATLEAYSNGQYCIKTWYGGTTDLIFTIGDDGSITPVNAQSSFKTYYYCNTGRSEDADDIFQTMIYQTKSFAYEGASKVSTLKKDGGSIKIYMDLNNYDGDEMDTTGDGYYTFTW